MSELLAIVGGGQMGTMIGQALRDPGGAAVEGGFQVGLQDRDRTTAERSVTLGGADLVLDRPADVLAASTVILAMPIPEIVRWIEEFGPRLTAGCLLMDTGSAKGTVVAAMHAHLAPAVAAVGGHPICGNELRGPDAARRELLRGATVALCPVGEDDAAAVRASALVRSLGARPLVVDWQTHDRVLARTSHLPHLLSATLVRLVQQTGEDPEVVAALLGPGFVGATRLADSDPEMVAGFLVANRAEVGRSVGELECALSRLLETLGHDPTSVVRELTEARDRRRGLLESGA